MSMLSPLLSTFVSSMFSGESLLTRAAVGAYVGGSIGAFLLASMELRRPDDAQSTDRSLIVAINAMLGGIMGAAIGACAFGLGVAPFLIVGWTCAQFHHFCFGKRQ